DLRPLFFDGLRPSQFSLVTTSPSQAALSRLPRQLLLQIALALSPGLHPKLDEIQGASPDPPPRRLDPSRVERGFGGLLHAGCTAPRMLAQVCRRRHRRYQGKEQAVTRGHGGERAREPQSMRCPDAFLAAAAAGQRAGAQRWPGRPLCTGPNGGGTPWDGPGAGMADEDRSVFEIFPHSLGLEEPPSASPGPYSGASDWWQL
ncbi:unnamed protein product, partial [Prorocentrum cordatum]